MNEMELTNLAGELGRSLGKWIHKKVTSPFIEHLKTNEPELFEKFRNSFSDVLFSTINKNRENKIPETAKIIAKTQNGEDITINNLSSVLKIIPNGSRVAIYSYITDVFDEFVKTDTLPDYSGKETNKTFMIFIF